MAQLYEGQWLDTAPAAEEIGEDGRFRRIDSPLREWISPDPAARFPAEAGRYHLWIAAVCPWAARTLAFRVLKGLEDAISVSFARPGLPREGWVFDQGPDGERPEGGYPLWRLYVEHDPKFTGKVTVPTLWDKKTRRIVNNESPDIIRMLNSEFDAIAGDDADFYPKPMRAEIDRLNDIIYANVNNGVYRCGFAKSQAAYEQAYDALFATLDELEARLSRQRYLLGGRITEADWRLFPTLVRFDVAYFSLFRCNKKRIADYPNLSAYMRELYALPGIAETVKPRYYVINYWSIARLNPLGIIPKGTPVDYTQPHDRARLAS